MSRRDEDRWAPEGFPVVIVIASAFVSALLGLAYVLMAVL